MLLLISLAVNAEYTHLGNELFDFTTDRAELFGVDNTPSLSGVQGLTSIDSEVPYIADLNGDGLEEIIVRDGSSIAVFQNSTLDLVAGIDTGLSFPYSNLEIFDIDGDSDKEIILAGGKTIKYWSYNGSALVLENTLAVTWAAFSTESYPMIRCRDTDECIWVAYRLNEYRFITFSSAATNQASVNLETGGANEYMCHAKFRNIVLANLDDTGEKEFVMSGILHNTGSQDELNIYAVWINSTNLADASLLWKKTILSYSISQSGNCGLYSPWLTAPTVYDWNLLNGNKDEVAITYRDSETSAKIAILYPQGTGVSTYDTVPSGGDIWETTTISNPIPLDYISSTSRPDVCMMGRDTNGICGLFCSAFDYLIFALDTEFTYPFEACPESEQDSYTQVIHSGNVSPYSTKTAADIITPFGIYTLFNVNSQYCEDNICTAGIIPLAAFIQNGTTIVADADGSGLGDIIIRDRTALYYIDDNKINQPGYIESVSFNPCLPEDIVKVNTTIKINVIAEDEDGDNVDARAILYNGESYNQTYNYSGVYKPHGFNFLFPFTASNVQNNAELKVCVRDETYPDVEDCEIIPFSVGADGASYGDSVCTQEYTAPVVPEVEPEAEIKDIPGLLLPEESIPPVYYPLLSLLIIFVVAGGSIFGAVRYGVQGSGILAGIGAGAAIITWIALILVEMVPAWTLIVTLLLAAGAIGLFIFSRLNR